MKADRVAFSVKLEYKLIFVTISNKKIFHDTSEDMLTRFLSR